MMLPTRTQLALWAATAALQGLLVWADMPPVYGWSLAALWLLVAGLDALWCYLEKPALHIRREHHPVQQSGQAFSVTLHITSAMRRPLTLHIFDHHPVHAATTALPVTSAIAPGETLHITYPLTLHRRGRFAFGGTQLRYTGRLHLWQRDILIPGESHIRVYPRFDHSSAAATFAGIRTLHPGHIRPLHNRSGNGDFSHLRDYLSGDSLNRIDHKASARHDKWLVKEYEYEHRQPVILMLDASRRQQTHHHGKTLFDELQNAATHLARAALKAGDTVGMQIFSDHVRHYLPPSRKNSRYRLIVENLFDRHADRHPPDYGAALQALYRHQRQRALIILLTTLENGDETVLRKHLPLMQKRHHLMLVNIRPPWLDGTGTAAGLREHALTESARILYDQAFTRMQERLAREKIIFIPARVDTLRPQLLNAYLSYKKHLKT